MKNTIKIVNLGNQSDHGNLIGVQPFVVPADYATKESFLAKMQSYLVEAKKANLLNPKTIVVYPEYIGTWLVATGLLDSAYRLKNISSVMMRIAIKYPLNFSQYFLRTRNIKKSIFLLNFETMSRAYNHTFSYLAKKYNVTIVAGSIVLPNPTVVDGKLATSHGPLYNVSVVYGRDGNALEPLAKKVSLVKEERDFTTPGTIEELPVYSLAAGRLAVLICADSWSMKSYEAIKEKSPTLIAVPSFLSPTGVWNKPWHGDKSLTEKEAWFKCAMAGKMKLAGIKYGMNVFLRGKLWDMSSDGQTISVANGKNFTAETESDQITSLWLGSK